MYSWKRFKELLVNKKFCFIIFGFLVILSLKVTYIFLLVPLEIQKYDTYQCDTVIVLGGIDDYDRVLKGLESAKKFNSILLFSGVNHKYKNVVNKFDIKNVIFEDNSSNTYENVKNSKLLLNHFDNICLVTSQAHIFRANKVFEQEGLKVIPIISNETNDIIQLNDFIPQLKYCTLNISVLYEYLAIIKYKLLKRI